MSWLPSDWSAVWTNINAFITSNFGYYYNGMSGQWEVSPLAGFLAFSIALLLAGGMIRMVRRVGSSAGNDRGNESGESFDGYRNE